jgi:putative sterol carrier protein
MPTKEEVQSTLPAMVQNFLPDKAQGVNAIIQFDISGDGGGLYWVKIADGKCEYGDGEVPNPAMVFKAKDEDFIALMTGKLNPVQAFMMGKIKVNNMELGMKMTSMFQMA